MPGPCWLGCGKIEKKNFHVYFYFDDVARCPDRIFVAQPFEDSYSQFLDSWGGLADAGTAGMFHRTESSDCRPPELFLRTGGSHFVAQRSGKPVGFGVGVSPVFQ